MILPAARRHRNPIRLVPASREDRYAFSEVCVVQASEGRYSVPLHRTNLARGPQRLLVVPDESALDVDAVEWHRLGRAVTFAHLGLTSRDYEYHFRLTATIALAEAARQIGRKSRAKGGRPARREPFYESDLSAPDKIEGETVYLEDLQGY